MEPNPDELAIEMKNHAEKLLEICTSLEKECCRGENVKCPFFYVSCSKLINTLTEFLKPMK